MRKIFTKTQINAFQFIHGFGKYVFVLLVIIGTGIMLNSYSPILYGKLIDSISSKNITSVVDALFPFASITIVIVLLSSIETLLAANLTSKIGIEHQKKLYQKIVIAKVSETDRIGLGSLITNMTSDISTIVSFDIEYVTTIVFITLNIIVPLIFIFTINIKLSAISVIFLPIACWIYSTFKSKMQKLFRAGQEVNDRYYQFILNNLQNISSIKLYRIEHHMMRKLDDIASDSYHVEKNKNSLNSLIEVLNSLSINLFSFVLIYVASCLIAVDEISLGILMSFNIYTMRLFEGIRTIQKIKFNEQPVKVALERLQKIDNLEIEDFSIYTELGAINKISMQDVIFSYDETSYILKGLTFEISKNGVYSIIGENGSGKTTLLKLMVKFYCPKSGEIYLNGVSFKNLSEQEVRRMITYVQKDPFLLNDTLFENIAVGSDVSFEEVMGVCAKVGLVEFIVSLPEQLNTFLFNDSDLLSSGLRQKMSFARALLHPSPIMIFDEITSDLDGHSELVLCNIMKELGKDCVVISVSHRLSTIAMSDYIFILRDGKIACAGSFSDLQATSADFKALFQNKNLNINKKT